KNCPESISAAYITPDGVIQEIHHLEHDDTNVVLAARHDIQFVLETKDGWFARHNIGVGTMIQSQRGPLAAVFLSRYALSRAGNNLCTPRLVATPSASCSNNAGCASCPSR